MKNIQHKVFTKSREDSTEDVRCRVDEFLSSLEGNQIISISEIIASPRYSTSRFEDIAGHRCIYITVWYRGWRPGV